MVGRKEVLRARPALDVVWDQVDRLFPVRVTRSWWARVQADDPQDPLARQVLPSPEELETSEEDLDDPVGEQRLVPVPWVVRKHPDRVLLLLTKRCHLYCRYCFRRTHAPGDGLDPTPKEWAEALDYVRREEVQEVILSGGDPLVWRDDALASLLERLAQMPAVRWVRVHTRAPITAPDRVTPGLVRALRASGPVWVVVHANHPRELSPEVDESLAMLVDGGVPVLNQAVLLRGVNDDARVLQALFEGLVARRVRPYYLHHTDAVSGNAHFRVSEARGLALYREVCARVSGLAVPRYVVDPPDGSGKRDVTDRRAWGTDG